MGATPSFVAEFVVVRCGNWNGDGEFHEKRTIKAGVSLVRKFLQTPNVGGRVEFALVSRTSIRSTNKLRLLLDKELPQQKRKN